MENEIYISKDGKFIIYNNLISGIGEKTKELEFNSLIEVFKKQSFFSKIVNMIGPWGLVITN